MVKSLEKLVGKSISVTIECNEHKNYYRTVAEELDSLDIEVSDFPHNDSDVAIEKDELYILRWYPDTPVGFCYQCFSSLENLVKYLGTL